MTPDCVAMLEEAMVHHRAGRLTEAEDLYRRAIRVQEHLSEWEWASLLYDKLAVAYEKEGKRREADQARVKSKALRPGS